MLPYVWQGAVGEFGWLTPTQMIDGLALYFGQHVLWPQGLAGPWDGGATLIMVLAAYALMGRKLGVIPVIAGCAGLGLALKTLF